MASVANLKREPRGQAAAGVRLPEKRAFARHPFRSATFPVRIGASECEIRLKDLSRGGASGLIGEPVRVGDHVVIVFDRHHQVEAEVRWVRRLIVGLTFTNPLSATFVERLATRSVEPLPAISRSARRSTPASAA